MKFTLLILSAGVLVASCNSKPKTAETLVQTTDTTVMVKPEIKDTVATVHAAPLKVKTTTSAGTAAHASTSSSSSSSSSSESTNSAKAKRGWSKTAKGAVIGGVVGAGTGVVVDKKHRVTGGIVGGAVGAGAGAIIGNQLDKKSGRH